LAGAALAILADARAALDQPEAADALTVHAVRKTLKRWRALMRLLAGPLGEQAQQMRAEARALMRELSGARDAQSALDALGDLRKVKPGPPATVIDSVRRRLTDIRNAAEQKSFTPDMRERLTRYLDYATLSLERWPLARMEFDAAGDALAATYRRARRGVPDDWASADIEQLHDLRRRIVEHRHQMDVAASLPPDSPWAKDIHRLRQQLGACQDLAVLADFAKPHQPLARWRSRLAAAIDARHQTHVRSAARLAQRLLGEKPKAFRKRIAASWDAASDGERAK
jgi:CHAD domain-containing protein